MSLDDALRSTMANVPDCLASGYIDIETGMLLGVQTAPGEPSDVIDSLAAATADLFQGASVQQIETLFKKIGGSGGEGEAYFQEVLVFSVGYLHVFMRTKRYPGHVVGFVCKRSANPGMVLTKARMGLEAVAAAV